MERRDLSADLSGCMKVQAQKSHAPRKGESDEEQ
jgi:hypothetical protein